MTPWTWWAGEIDDDTYGLAEAATREDVIREASQVMRPGDKFRIVEARASTAAQHEGSDCVPFLRTRNHEIITVGPVEVGPAPQTNTTGWQPIETAPRDGTWFIARTASGYERRVHYADIADRLPIDHSDEVWSTAPVEWRPTPETNMHGPYGWLIKPIGLAEDHWYLANEPSEHPAEEFSVPLFTQEEQKLATTEGQPDGR